MRLAHMPPHLPMPPTPLPRLSTPSLPSMLRVLGSLALQEWIVACCVRSLPLRPLKTMAGGSTLRCLNTARCDDIAKLNIVRLPGPAKHAAHAHARKHREGYKYFVHTQVHRSTAQCTEKVQHIWVAVSLKATAGWSIAVSIFLSPSSTTGSMCLKSPITPWWTRTCARTHTTQKG